MKMITETVSTELVIELKTPLWFRLFAPVAVVVGGIILIVFPVIHWMNSPAFNSPSVIGLSLLLVVFGIWFIRRGVIRMWHEAGFALRVDDTGITLHTRSGIKFVGWHEISMCTMMPKNEQGKMGLWVILVDKNNNILLQWDRNWYSFSPGSLRKFDNLTKFIEDRIGKEQ